MGWFKASKLMANSSISISIELMRLSVRKTSSAALRLF
jgi:hypothetical protein